jgi:uncharacterized protein YhaN
MELCRLTLEAFGPFTQRRLDFASSGASMHIVYGANEAGKSSALRGLKALLYGIEVRSSDNFVHTHQQLRVGGLLRSQSGMEREFVRRKGRKDTLLSIDGEPLDEDVLSPFLQGTSKALFESLFGIDHHALVRGGEEILDQRGEVGEALFSAALGSQALHRLLERLDAEADTLFRPRGATQKINARLKEYADIHKRIREESLSSTRWQEKYRESENIDSSLRAAREELAQSLSRLNRLQRIQRLQPMLARRGTLLRQLAGLQDVVILPEGFGKRRLQAVTALDRASEMHDRARANYLDLQQQLRGISVNESLLQLDEVITELHERVGAHRKAMQDRPGLQAQYQQLLDDATVLLREVRPDVSIDAVEQLRPVFAKRQRINELGAGHRQLVANLERNRVDLRDTHCELQETLRRLQQVADSGSAAALHEILKRAARAGDLGEELRSCRLQLQQLEQQGGAELARLTHWQGELDELPLLPLPSMESVERFEESFEQHARLLQRLTDKQAELQEEHGAVLAAIGEAQGAAALPTEELLDEARRERDTLWKLLRRGYVDAEDIAAEIAAMELDAALPDLFEQRIDAADEIADRLRREAERVHKLAALHARREQLQLRSVEIDAAVQRCLEEHAGVAGEWMQLWQSCAIAPLSPREMREWLLRAEGLCKRATEIRQLRARCSDTSAKIAQYHGMISAELSALGRAPAEELSLERLMAHGEAVHAAMERLQEQRQQLLRDEARLNVRLRSLQAEQGESETAHASWLAEWREAVAGLGLAPQASPAEAGSLIEKCAELFGRLEEARRLQQRIAAIDSDAEQFRAEVQRMVAAAGEQLDALPEAEAAIRLSSLLAANREHHTRRREIRIQAEKHHQEMQQAAATISSMQQRLQALCAEAGCSAVSELETAEQRSSEHQRLAGELRDLETQILDIGGGAALAELEQQAGEEHADSLPAAIDTLKAHIDQQLQPLLTQLAEARGRLHKELELMDGSDAVARLAEEGQAALADIRAYAEHYARLKLAARLLRDQIEHYRQQHQGPLVKCASKHFAALTGGSFASLETDFNLDDEPVLVGIRAHGERVHVEGMSTGTRDQLYLALRLASLEKYMHGAEPMPFIVDDILVDFDDRRSAAALQRLAELSRQTQVILFTHHSRVVEQAKALGRGVAQIHELQ